LPNMLNCSDIQASVTQVATRRRFPLLSSAFLVCEYATPSAREQV
jgi:hypothetical protein